MGSEATSGAPDERQQLDLSAFVGSGLLEGVNAEAVYELLFRCPRRKLKAGEELIRFNQVNRNMFILLSGELGVSVQEDASSSLATLSAGETVGEVSALDQKPATASVRALSDCELLTVDIDTLWSLIGASHEFSINLIIKTAERLRSSNQSMHEVGRLRAQFEKAALYDALTGVANRRWLETTMPRIFSRHTQSDEGLSVAMIDIDHFKSFNDRFGHQAGDRVLMSVARTLALRLRPADFLVRIGGEEFVAILPETGMKGAAIAAERMRTAIGSLVVQSFDGTVLPFVTISIGIANSSTATHHTELLASADAALYDAKESGRNCIRLAPAAGGELS
ncbi:MAG: hypothetical protein CL908_26975 [Deltaproteobacteria bacterium]|nr:hypothetical protein [Deltaproteobacteria bacterium]